jgi:putative effector of murein hydrolase LrgA (UPF0299 family)
MLRAFATLLVFQCLGEVASFALRLPVPGPVLGMLCFLLYLAIAPGAAAALRDSVIGLLGHLSLLFVPAGVGVMLHARRLADEGFAIAVALVASTALSIIVTALVVDRTRRWLEPHRSVPASPDGGERG